MTATYKLIAQATDGGGLFCRSDISLKVLDVNDNAPSFSSTHYLASVYENAAPNALLTRLQASDPDEGKLVCCNTSGKAMRKTFSIIIVCINHTQSVHNLSLLFVQKDDYHEHEEEYFSNDIKSA